MANVCKKYVITTRGKNYVVGDDIIMKLKNGIVLVGIIEDIECWDVVLHTINGRVEIPTNLIED